MSSPYTEWNRARSLGLWVIGLSLLALVIWASLAPLHSAVVAFGQVKVEGNRKLVQHLTGGVVKRLLVKDGQEVFQGQLLLELEGSKEEAGVAQLREALANEIVRQARLEAEQDLRGSFAEPVVDASEDAQLVRAAFARETRAFELRRHLLLEQSASGERQLQVSLQERSALHRQAESAGLALRLAQEELALNASLQREQFVSKARLLGLERVVAEQASKLSEYEAAVAQSEHRRADLVLRLAALRNEYQRSASEELKESSARLTQLREQLRPARESARQLGITAPVSGTVVGLRVNAAGEVVQARESLMEIVPAEELLVVEARMPIDTAESLRVGQPTELRFIVAGQRNPPKVTGRVSYVSADAVADKNGQSFYIVRVRPQPDSLRDAGVGVLRPGMATEVYVLVEARSALSYLLSPITMSLRQAMREQ